MLAKGKVNELFCIADVFCKFFDALMENNTISDKSGIIIVIPPCQRLKSLR